MKTLMDAWQWYESARTNRDAKEAFERLKEFLETLSIAVETEREEPGTESRGSRTSDSDLSYPV